MVLIDTSIWIDFFAGRANRDVDALLDIINLDESVAFTGVILQELFQGCRSDKEAKLIEQHFAPFIELQPQHSTYWLAGKIYRDCRKQGVTVRSSIDCLIVSLSLEYKCSLLHKDRDFYHIAKVFNVSKKVL